MLLRTVKVVVMIAFLAIVALAIYLYKHRYEMIDCRPPYFLYEASIGGTKGNKYIVVGIKSTPFSELSNVIINIQLPNGIKISKLNTLRQDIQFDSNSFSWKIKHISKNNEKTIAIPIVIHKETQKPVIIEFWLYSNKARNCPGDEDGTYTNKIYIYKVSNKETQLEVKHDGWRLVK